MLDRAIGHIAEGNNMSRIIFARRWKRRRDFRGFVNKFATKSFSRVKEREADNRVTVTKASGHFFASQAASQGSDTEFNVGHILI